MMGKKFTLGALVLALSSGGCIKQENTPLKKTETLKKDGSFDSIDDRIDVSGLSSLLDSTYFIVSELQYENPDGEIETFHSLGSGVLYKDIGERTCLATAKHVVDNEDSIFDFFGKEYKKKSEKFYLLEDRQVYALQRVLKFLTEVDDEEAMYFINDRNNKQKLTNVVKTSEKIKILLSLINPRKVRVDATNDSKDIAVISVGYLPHVPIPYDIGDTDKLQPQNLVFVTGWPLGLLKNLSRGFVTSAIDSPLIEDEPESRFIFDASISPGNSGGGIYATTNGRFKLIGITSAMYLRANDLYIGIKINAISDVFKGDSITCNKEWECNRELNYKINLSD